MVNYASLLLGGKVSRKSKKEECPSSSSSESESEEEEQKEMMGEGKKKKGVKGMSYEERCKNLAKARATRMANLKKKKTGGGQYTQDYVDESQINYLGSPLDMYYRIPDKEVKELKEERGENIGKGMRLKPKGKMSSEKMKIMGMMGGKMGKNGYEVRGGDMSFMENSMHTGMDMPTKEQFVKGGKMKKASKKMPEHQMDIPDAIKQLGMLASKFGLRLIK